MVTEAERLLETTHDRNAFASLVGVLESGMALALVGAGFSARVGFPSWEQLLGKMEARLARHTETLVGERAHAGTPIPRSVAEHEDILWRAEELRERMSEDLYREFLHGVFARDPGEDPCLDMLVQMPFRAFVTTNYDRSIDEAYRRVHGRELEVLVWDDGADVQRLMYDLITPACPPKLLYLHGRIADAGSLVLSDRDYTERYLRSDSTVKKLFALFAMQRFVFFGFSLRDPDLSAILRQVTGALGYEQSRHFALVGIKPEREREVDRKRLKRKFGVEAVFYDSSNRHARLQALMALSLRECGVTPHIAEEPRIEAAAAVARPRNRMNPRYPDDPRKGMFGGQPEANGRLLSAKVEPLPGDRRYFTVRLTVEALTGAAPLHGDVRFYLHDTFEPSMQTRKAVRGVATLELVCYGAFTVGVITDGGTGELELDLTTVPDAPKRFIEN